MTYSVRNIVIALVLAAVAAMLVILYTGNVQQQARDSQKHVTVVVAKNDIAAGMAIGDVIAAGDLAERSVVAGDLVPGAYRSIGDLNQSLATGTAIPAGSQVTPTMLSEATSASIRDQLQGTERAVQVAYNPNRVLDGTLRAGDHVDVIAEFTVQPSSNSSKFGQVDAARVLLTDIEVLSTKASGSASTALTADSDTNGGTGSTDGTQGAAMILKIPQEALPAFDLARAKGDLWYVLRPAHGAQDTPPTVATACSVLTPGLNLVQIKAYLPLCFGYGGKH